MNQIKSLFAFLFMLVAMLFTASDAFQERSVALGQGFMIFLIFNDCATQSLGDNSDQGIRTRSSPWTYDAAVRL